jgi:hypothetical protein
VAFDLRQVLTGTSQVDSWSTWHGLDQDLEWGKFIIDVHRRDMESPVQRELMNLLISFKDRIDFSVGEAIDSCKTDLSTQS